MIFYSSISGELLLRTLQNILFSEGAWWGLSDGYQWIALIDLDFLLRSAQIYIKCTILCNLSSVCDIHFCIWKMSKFIFMGSPLCSILVCKIPEFWSRKLWDQNFVQFDSGNINIKENKKPGFAFSIGLRTKFVWSHGLLMTDFETLMTLLQSSEFLLWAVCLCETALVIKICPIMTAITNAENSRQYKNRFYLLVELEPPPTKITPSKR